MARARRTLTKDTVRSITPSAPGRKEFVWDDLLLGFSAYRQQNGTVVFVDQYRIPMRPARRITIGRLGEVTPAQAREIAQKHAGDLLAVTTPRTRFGSAEPRRWRPGSCRPRWPILSSPADVRRSPCPCR